MSLDVIFAVAIVRVFMVKDDGDCFIRWHCYNFSSVKSSGAVVPVFVVFDSFLGIAHFRVADPQIVFVCLSFPFDEIVNDFRTFLASATVDRTGWRVQALFDFEFLLVIGEVGRRRRRDFLVR